MIYIALLSFIQEIFQFQAKTLFFIGPFFVSLGLLPLIVMGATFKKILISPEQIKVDFVIFNYDELIRFNLNYTGRNRPYYGVHFIFLKNGKYYEYYYKGGLLEIEKNRIAHNQILDMREYWTKNYSFKSYDEPGVSSIAHLVLSFLSIIYFIIIVLIFYFLAHQTSLDDQGGAGITYQIPFLVWFITFILHLMLYPILRKNPKKLSLVSRMFRYRRYASACFFLGFIMYIFSYQLIQYYNQHHGFKF